MELHMYNEVFSSKIESYYLTEKQLYFTDADQYPILARVDQKLVTFFDLHKNAAVKPYSEKENAILVRTLSTAFQHQGKGFAKKALLELPNSLKTNYQGIDEIVLAALTIKRKLRKDCRNAADLLIVINVKWAERSNSSL